MNQAYLFAINNEQRVVTITPGFDVPFNLVVEKIGIIGPQEQTTFIVQITGKYQYSFKIEGNPTFDLPGVMGLTRNGQIVDSTLSVIGGSGIIQLNRGNSVTLRLNSTSPSGPIELNSTIVNQSTNASLSLVLIPDKKIKPIVHSRKC